jgi:hypothetical protein
MPQEAEMVRVLPDRGGAKPALVAQVALEAGRSLSKGPGPRRPAPTPEPGDSEPQHLLDCPTGSPAPDVTRFARPDSTAAPVVSDERVDVIGQLLA